MKMGGDSLDCVDRPGHLVIGLAVSCCGLHAQIPTTAPRRGN